MKKVTQILVALVLSLGLASVGQVANAQTPDCDNIVIYNTGPGSDNVVLCINDATLEVECQNNIYVLNESSQEAVSGEAVSQGSTAGGNAVSGSATNENGATVQIGANCGEVEAPVTPTTPETPSTPVVTPVATPKEKPALLPYTSAGSLAETIAVGLIALATVLLTARIAVTVYRRLALK